METYLIYLDEQYADRQGNGKIFSITAVFIPIGIAQDMKTAAMEAYSEIKPPAPGYIDLPKEVKASDLFREEPDSHKILFLKRLCEALVARNILVTRFGVKWRGKSIMDTDNQIDLFGISLMNLLSFVDTFSQYNQYLFIVDKPEGQASQIDKPATQFFQSSYMAAVYQGKISLSYNANKFLDYLLCPKPSWLSIYPDACSYLRGKVNADDEGVKLSAFPNELCSLGRSIEPILFELTDDWYDTHPVYGTKIKSRILYNRGKREVFKAPNTEITIGSFKPLSRAVKITPSDDDVIRPPDDPRP